MALFLHEVHLNKYKCLKRNCWKTSHHIYSQEAARHFRDTIAGLVKMVCKQSANCLGQARPLIKEQSESTGTSFKSFFRNLEGRAWTPERGSCEKALTSSRRHHQWKTLRCGQMNRWIGAANLERSPVFSPGSRELLAWIRDRLFQRENSVWHPSLVCSKDNKDMYKVCEGNHL